MTKKDFELIAAAIRAAKQEIRATVAREHANAVNDGANYARDALADALATTNPKFDRARFLAACGAQS